MQEFRTNHHEPIQVMLPTGLTYWQILVGDTLSFALPSIQRDRKATKTPEGAWAELTLIDVFPSQLSGHLSS